MAKLSNDYIRWTLTLNTSQTKKEIHNLTELIKTLEKGNEDLENKQKDLEKSNQKSSVAYRENAKKIKENNKAINEANAKLVQLTSRFKLSSLSANQLAKRARELRRELMNTSHAANPKRFKELQQQLDEVNKAYRRALDGEKGFASHLKEWTTQIGRGILLNIGQNILQQFTSTFSNIFSIIADFEAANSKLAAVLGTTAGSIADLTGAAMEPVAPEEMSLKEQILQGLMEAANRYGRSGAVRMAKLFATKRL